MIGEILGSISRTAGDFGGFVTAGDWTAKLWRILRLRRKVYAKELEELNSVLLGDPLLLARYYIEPDCQESNPADRRDDDFLVSREPIFKKLSEFFKSRSFEGGSNHLFVLSDAGMGKTSLITMLKLLNMNRFWPLATTCEAMKLGPSTLAKIGKIKIHRNTILLLDALDEDPTSFGRVEERIIELLDATADFHKVIITCRTQFFSGYRSDPFERPGQVVIGGYTCPTKYLANFDERKVDKYLTKRFGKYSWSGRKAIKRARAMVSGMGSLRCRPMLLAHIDILLNSPGLAVRPTEFEIYESLLKAWLNRQELKSKVPATELWRVCAILANRMLKAGNQRRISQAWLDAFKEGANIMRSLGAMDLEGRSLLNRTSDGDFRFSHETIQEFLCAHGALSADESVPLERFVATPFVAKLIWEKILSDRPFEPTRIDLVDFSGASLNQVDLRERDLTGIRLPRLRFENSDFTGANLTGANLAGCSFINCNFTSATLDGIVVDGTDISGADFTEASLRGVRGSRTNFSGCNFYMSIVSESELKDCKFTGSTSLGWANFSRCSLVRCDFDETDWSGPNYRSEPDWSAFKGGDLWRQVGQGARAGIETPWSLEECTFQRVINMCPEFAKRLPLG